MAYDFDGSAAYISASSTLLTNEPIDMAAYVNPDNATVNHTAICLGNGGGAQGVYKLKVDGVTAGDPIRSYKEGDTGGVGQSSTSSGFSASAWNATSSSFISDTSRASWIAGGSKGTDATNIADPTPDKISIGSQLTNAASTYFDGKIAEAYILSANMSDAQHGYVGANGFISPIWFMPLSDIKGYYPLINDYNNRMSTASGYPNLTATGSPSKVTNPPRVLFGQINEGMFF